MSKKEETQKETQEEKTQEESKEDEIKRLQDEIRTIRQKGRFVGFYNDVRKGAVEINKKDIGDEAKKIELFSLLEKVTQELKKIL